MSVNKEKIRASLIDQVSKALQRQKDTINKALELVKEGLTNETKSSMGDKFETTRAHLQAEMVKLTTQLSEIVPLEDRLYMVENYTSVKQVRLGSIVYASSANYFVSLPFGKLQVNDTIYYALSPTSPIGMLLLGKSIGETVTFRNRNILITDID